MAEWSNAPDSKSGIRFLPYRGFESLSLRQYVNTRAVFLTHFFPHNFPNSMNMLGQFSCVLTGSLVVDALALRLGSDSQLFVQTLEYPQVELA